MNLHQYDFINNNYLPYLSPGYLVYDLEIYPNVFTFSGVHAETKQLYNFEISNRKNELVSLCHFIELLRVMQCTMVGFNNLGFDYPLLHFIYLNRNAVTVKDIYLKADQIVNTAYENRNAHVIWSDKQIVKQLDLFKIHHFDNVSKFTSLKTLEINMRSDSVEDLPFKPGTILQPHEIDQLIAYNNHDTLQTLKFFELSESHVNFRKILSEKYEKDFTNHNDTKIGKDYVVMELEKHSPGCCYRQINGKKKTMQTKRDFINLGDVVLPYISFQTPEFIKVLEFFKNKTITETKGVFDAANVPEDLIVLHNKEKRFGVEVNGFKFIFGTGGIHGSVTSKKVSSEPGYIVEDWDVASYYPNLAIANNLYPEHLGIKFCEIYKSVYEQRKQYKKGTPENAMLKLALNGVYGDSNNQYSPFYDSKYTMSITINGQLLLCVLAEQLFRVYGLELIQINTDGLTIKYPRMYQEYVHEIMKWWEKFTCLTLENVEYKFMAIRDVNNYIACDVNGKVKRKGAFEYKLDWHQNHSALVIPKAVSEYIIHGVPPEEFIRNHTDIFDFLLGTKIPRGFVLRWGDEVIQNISRYYISTDGDILEKLMPAKGKHGAYKRKNGISDHYYNQILNEVGDNWDERIHTKNKSIYEDRITAIQSGWTVQICNNIKNFTFVDLNYDYYIEKAWELIKDAGLKDDQQIVNYYCY